MSSSWNIIVVGYDDTGSARRAVARAADLAASGEAKLIVTGVARSAPSAVAARGLGPTDQVDPPEPIEPSSSKPTISFRDVASTPSSTWRSASPAETIVKVADKHRADAIVVGSRESGLADRVMWGSVSQGVCKQAHCDVVIVH
jgi:nucleotide-binding universal stress UspA family protein